MIVVGCGLLSPEQREKLYEELREHSLDDNDDAIAFIGDPEPRDENDIKELALHNIRVRPKKAEQEISDKKHKHPHWHKGRW